VTTLVTVRHVESGENSSRMSVDAADLLATGEYEQVSGPTIRVALPEKPKKELGPPVAAPKAAAAAKAPPELDRAHLKHAGFGKWNVIRATARSANDEALTKPDCRSRPGHAVRIAP
jgi:hypothetical protein